jgi:hypothetical protein
MVMVAEYKGMVLQPIHLRPDILGLSTLHAGMEFGGTVLQAVTTQICIIWSVLEIVVGID